jgi:diaminopimelate epimerase
MEFFKFEGIGNDFLIRVLDGRKLDSSLVRAVADRHFGFGADGVIEVDLDAEIPVMTLYNQDGTLAEMSGNGLRCLGHFLSEIYGMELSSVMTGAGLRGFKVIERKQNVLISACEMGTVATVGKGVRGELVSVGNPHEVLLVTEQEFESIDISELGESIGSAYCEGANVEVVKVVDRNHLVMKVFERGVGPTMACGTGSVAAAFVAHGKGLIADEAVVENPGGNLRVRFDGGSTWLEGPTSMIGKVSWSGS